MVEMDNPQGYAAQQFMEHKGLGHVRPLDVDKIEGQSCWYFYYDLPEGTLELEVSWGPATGWQVLVTTFNRHAS